MAKCLGCGRFLSPTGAVACTNCTSRYHKGCAAIPDNVTPPKDWVCPECAKKRTKCDSGAHTLKGREVRSSLIPTETLTSATSAFAGSDVCALRKELAEYMAEQREFREELRASLASMGARMDGLERRLEALEHMEASVGDAQVSELERTITQLKQDLNERDQEALLTDLDIGHLPEEKGVNVMHTVTVLAAKLGVTLQDRDIVFAERVGPVLVDSATAAGGEAGNRTRPRRVVVRFARRELRDEMLRAARVRRNLSSTDIGLAGPPQRVYINERLTKTNRLLFYRARVECAQRQWRYTWTKRGRVFVRQGEGKQVYHIRSDADLERVFSKKTVGEDRS